MTIKNYLLVFITLYKHSNISDLIILYSNTYTYGHNILSEKVDRKVSPIKGPLNE